MKPVPPHPLLSAYLDGELSPREREQVERLLEESESARQELRELGQIGELLRQLPRESLPKAFASDLWSRLSDTAVFENETQTLRIPVSDSSSKEKPSVLSKRNRNWLGIAIVGISATALSLTAMLWFGNPLQNRNELALKSPSQTPADTASVRESRELDRPLMPMAAGDAASVDALNESRFYQEQETQSQKADREQLTPKMSQAMRALSVEAEKQQPLTLGNADSNDLPADRLVEALDQTGEQVAVVKLQVGDRQQGLRELQALLKQHQIAQTPAKDAQYARSDVTESDVAKDATILAVYVDASDERLAAALRDLTQKSAFRKVSMEAPIAVAGLDSLMASRNDRFRSRTENPKAPAASRFGGSPLRSPNGVRGGQMPKPAPTMTPGAEKAPTESAPEPAKDAATPEKTAPAARRVPARSFAPARSNPPPRLEKIRPQTDKPGEAKAELSQSASAGRAAPDTAPSTQRELTLPAEVLAALQKQIADPLSKKAEAPAEQPGKRVQILFVLVNETPPNASEGIP